MEKGTNSLGNPANGNDNQMHQHSTKNSKTSSESKTSEKNAFPSKTQQIESIEESPKKLLGKWHKTVRIGSSTKSLLNKWKSHSTTIDQPMKNTNDPLIHDEIGKGASDDASDNGKNSTWSEHVWSTFIHRGYSDDVTEKKPSVIGKDLLTNF